MAFSPFLLLPDSAGHTPHSSKFDSGRFNYYHAITGIIAAGKIMISIKSFYCFALITLFSLLTISLNDMSWL